MDQLPRAAVTVSTWLPAPAPRTHPYNWKGVVLGVEVLGWTVEAALLILGSMVLAPYLRWPGNHSHQDEAAQLGNHSNNVSRTTVRSYPQGTAEAAGTKASKAAGPPGKLLAWLSTSGAMDSLVSEKPDRAQTQATGPPG